MADEPVSVMGFTGVDATTDPVLLGRSDETKSSLAFNYRGDRGVKTGRKGYVAVTQFGSYRFKSAGVYFPYGARAVVPIVTTSYANTFYLASDVSNEQTEMTIEFWMKAEYRAFDRDVIYIPVDMDSGTKHMKVSLSSSATLLGRQLLSVTLILENSSGPHEQVWIQPGILQDDDIPTDDAWHHIAVVRKDGENNVELYVDNVQKSDLTPVPGSDYSDRIADDTTFQGGDGEKMWHNKLCLGCEGVSLSEVRFWDHARTVSEISSYYDEHLDHTDSSVNSGLVCCIPFDEADGKTFTTYHPNNTDIVGGEVEGYLTPQEPFVEEDTENDRHILRFTGHNCFCAPSLRSKFDYPDDLTPVDHFLGNEDAGYDGGILWDTRLSWAADKATALQTEGVYSGWAQMRFRLRNLKEGVLAGRLGMVFDTSDQKYRLYLIHNTAGYVFLSDAVIDESWIGVDKTVTVKFVGNSSLGSDAVTFWEDDTDVTDSSTTSTEWVWSDGSNILNNSFPYNDGYLGEDGTYGSIAGSALQEEYCVAMDLIFFRQWWDSKPKYYTGASPDDDFVAETYNLTKLTQSYRITDKGGSGWIAHNGQTAEFASGEYGYNSTVSLKYLVAPLNKYVRGDLNEWDRSGADSDTYISIYKGTVDEGIIKHDTLVRRMSAWGGTAGEIVVLPPVASGDDYSFFMTSKDIYGTDAYQGYFAYFSGGILSNLVNELDSDIFRLNRKKRPVTSVDTDNAEATVNYAPINNVIDDGSPIQGFEQFSGVRYKSRYFVLSTVATSTYVYGDMESRKPRWCIGGIDDATPKPIRGIYRYKSEDERVNKLIVVSGCGTYEFDPSTGELTGQSFGWLDRNDDEHVNGIVINNKLVLMDSKSAVKLNYKDNFSRLGIETPQSFYIDVSDSVTDAWVGSAAADVQFAYTCQFRDSENNALSGTMPVFTDLKQHVQIHGDQGGITRIDVFPYSCLDPNVDEILIYRTRDIEDGGSTGEFLLAGVVGNSHGNPATDYFRDIWDDSQLSAAASLSLSHYGTGLIPKRCKAMASGFGRLFIMNSEESKASIYWSEVDALGFPIVDQVPENQQIILEEGGTTGGTAIISFSEDLYAFKEDAIFRIYESAPGVFAASLIYKGVGAVSQPAVKVARNAIFSVDRNGLYVFQGGEPTLASPAMRAFFRDEVSQDNIDKAFLLYDKARGRLLCFVPADGSTYCDRCVIFDFETTMTTVDLVPDVVCGFVDEEDIYLGTPYGQILKYSDTFYTDVVSTGLTGAADSVDATSLTDTGASFAVDGSLLGALVYAVDVATKKIWVGTITGSTANVLTVDQWKSLFNASGNPSGTPTYFVGYTYLYEKGPVFSFLNPQQEKALSEIEIFTNYQGSAINIYSKITVNQGTSNPIVNVVSHSGDLSSTKYLGGLHRNIQMELATLVNAEFRHKETIFHVAWRRGRNDA